MSVKFEDYYKRLGVERSASQDEIQKAFRRLARQYHPDVNSAPEAEEQFKRINEAYEVLKDPEKRRRYDALGSSWRQGQDFTPPPGWDGFSGAGFGGPGAGVRFDFGGAPGMGGGFSDFFSFFQQGAPGGAGFGGPGMGGFGGAGFGPGGFAPGASAAQPKSLEVEVEIPLEDIYHKTKRALRVNIGQGQLKTYNVRIPAGTSEGSAIRLSDQAPGHPPGDLILRVKIKPHARYEARGFDLLTTIELAPWEHALGAQIELETFEGALTLKIPALMPLGRKLRLRERGLDQGGGKGRGDLLVGVELVHPAKLSPQELELYRELAKVSAFKPRGQG